MSSPIFKNITVLMAWTQKGNWICKSWFSKRRLHATHW